MRIRGDIDIMGISHFAESLANAQSVIPSILPEAGSMIRVWLVGNIDSQGKSEMLKTGAWDVLSPFTQKLRRLSGIPAKEPLQGLKDRWIIESESGRLTVGLGDNTAIYHHKGASQTATKKQSKYMWARYGIGFKPGRKITLPKRMLAGDLSENALKEIADLLVKKALNSGGA